MKKILITLGVLFFAGACASSKTVKPLTQFNVNCPAATACGEAAKSYDDCRAKKQGKVCDLFVEEFRHLSFEYDCKRSFDAAPVPAAWLCGGTDIDHWADLLSKLKSLQAYRFFASDEFRHVLYGELADKYQKRSQEAAKKLDIRPSQ